MSAAPRRRRGRRPAPRRRHWASASSSVALHGQHLVEAADGEDLGHHALQRGHAQARLRCAHLPGGDHQHAQAHAADVVDRREVEHQRALASGGLGQQRRQGRFQLGGAAVVDAARWGDHDRVGKLLRGELHGATSGSWPGPGLGDFSIGEAAAARPALAGPSLCESEPAARREQRKRAAEAETAQWRERLAHLVRVHTVGEMSAALAHEINAAAGRDRELRARRAVSRSAEAGPRPRDVAGRACSTSSSPRPDSRRRRRHAPARSVVQRHAVLNRRRSMPTQTVLQTCADMAAHAIASCASCASPLACRAAVACPARWPTRSVVQQVVLNLLRNAMERNRRRAACRRGTRAIALERALRRARSTRSRCSVADRGPGIAEGALEQRLRVLLLHQAQRPGHRPGASAASCSRPMAARCGQRTTRAAARCSSALLPAAAARLMRMSAPQTVFIVDDDEAYRDSVEELVQFGRPGRRWSPSRSASRVPRNATTPRAPAAWSWTCAWRA